MSSSWCVAGLVGMQFRNCLEVFNVKNYIEFQTHKTKIAPLFQLNAPSWEFRVWQLIYQDSVVSWGTKLVILNHMVSTLSIVCIKASVTSVVELKGADFILLMLIFTLKIISILFLLKTGYHKKDKSIYQSFSCEPFRDYFNLLLAYNLIMWLKRSPTFLKK